MWLSSSHGLKHSQHHLAPNVDYVTAEPYAENSSLLPAHFLKVCRVECVYNMTQALEEPHSNHKVLLTALAEAKGGVRGFLSLNLCNHLRMPAPCFLTGEETFAQCITSSREEGVSRCQREIKNRSMEVNMIQIHYRCTKSHNGMPYYLK